MHLATWLAYVLASCVLLLIPGPTVLLVVSYALTQGRRIAIAMAAGVALGDFTAMTLSLVGLGALLAAWAALFTLLKWVGAAYLVYLGVRLWRAEPTLPDAAADEPPTSARPVFLHAFVVTALNPKSIAFFVAFMPQFIDRSAPLAAQFVVLEATFVSLALVNALAYALAADRLRAQVRKPAVLRGMNRAGAACLVGMGAATVALSHA